MIKTFIDNYTHTQWILNPHSPTPCSYKERRCHFKLHFITITAGMMIMYKTFLSFLCNSSSSVV